MSRRVDSSTEQLLKGFCASFGFGDLHCHSGAEHPRHPSLNIAVDVTGTTQRETAFVGSPHERVEGSGRIQNSNQPFHFGLVWHIDKQVGFSPNLDDAESTPRGGFLGGNLLSKAMPPPCKALWLRDHPLIVYLKLPTNVIQYLWPNICGCLHTCPVVLAGFTEVLAAIMAKDGESLADIVRQFWDGFNVTRVMCEQRRVSLTYCLLQEALQQI